MSLSVMEVAYKVICDSIVESSPSSPRMEEEDPFALLSWVITSSSSHNFLENVFPFDEAILKALNGPERPWEELHHHSYFLLKLKWIEHDEFRITLSDNNMLYNLTRTLYSKQEL